MMGIVRKIVFIDFDGVLNIQSPTYTSCHHKHLGMDALEPHLIKRLEFMLERIPGLLIVISSSWRQEVVLEKLKAIGFKYLNNIIGRTPRDVKYRGNQIHAWLTENNHDDMRYNETKYIVLEDEVVDVCGEYCSAIPKENVIEVDDSVGLSDKNVIDSVIYLNDLEQHDGDTMPYNDRVLDYYLHKGYRAQLCISDKQGNIEYARLKKMWDTITINNKDLEITLSNKEEIS